MKYFVSPLFLGLAIILGASFASADSAAPAPSPAVNMAHAPKIYFPKPNFDFGIVDEAGDIVHEFHFRNRGKSTLKISHVGTSCGCTAAVADSHYSVPDADKTTGVSAVIPPGGHAVIKATYHTAGRPGAATKYITVTSNDPLNPNFQLKLQMNVVPVVDLQPERLYFYAVPYKTVHTATLKVLGKPGIPFHVLSAKSASGTVTVTSVTPLVPGEDKRFGATIEVDTPATLPIGSFNDEIILETDSKKKPEVRVPVMGEVVGHIQFAPKDLYFMPHQEAPVTVTFTDNDNKGFAIRSVKSEKNLVRASVRKVSTPGGDQYILIANVVKNVPQESDGKDVLTITTNDDLQPTLSINVQANK